MHLEYLNYALKCFCLFAYYISPKYSSEFVINKIFMENQTIQTSEFLSKWGLHNTNVYRNPSVPLIYELSM